MSQYTEPFAAESSGLPTNTRLRRGEFSGKEPYNMFIEMFRLPICESLYDQCGDVIALDESSGSESE